MSINVTCPYCGEEQEEETEDIREDCNYEAECGNCEKVFGYSVSISITSDSHKLPCGGQDGDGPHDWKKVIGFPEEYYKNKYYCIHCGLEIEMPDIKEKVN